MTKKINVNQSIERLRNSIYKPQGVDLCQECEDNIRFKYNLQKYLTPKRIKKNPHLKILNDYLKQPFEYEPIMAPYLNKFILALNLAHNPPCEASTCLKAYKGSKDTFLSPYHATDDCNCILSIKTRLEVPEPINRFHDIFETPLFSFSKGSFTHGCFTLSIPNNAVIPYFPGYPKRRTYTKRGSFTIHHNNRILHSREFDFHIQIENSERYTSIDFLLDDIYKTSVINKLQSYLHQCLQQALVNL
jgi:hypothetical protein